MPAATAATTATAVKSTATASETLRAARGVTSSFAAVVVAAEGAGARSTILAWSTLPVLWLRITKSSRGSVIIVEGLR